MNVSHRSLHPRVLLAVAACLSGACSPAPPIPNEPPRVIIPADGGRPVTTAELDELTRAFADRYIGLLYSACDAVKLNNPDAAQRREAQTLLVDCASNIYDIASNADAFTRLLDLVVVTRLMSQVWVDDGRVGRVFGERGGPMAGAMLHARAEAQALAARVLTVEQLGAMDSLLEDWRRENPEMIHASYVRFSNFAIGRGRSSASEVLNAGGFLAQVGQAGQAVDEARLLGERMFYQLKREPTLLRWQAAAAKDDMLATPEVGSGLADVHRLTEQVEQFPAHLAAEREALLAAIDSRVETANSSIANARAAIAEMREVIASLEPASTAVRQLVESADVLFTRYDAWDRWAVGVQPRPFEIREYTEMVREAATTAQRLSETIKTSGELAGSPAWSARLEELNRSVDGRIENAAVQSRLLIKSLFLRVYIALGVLAVLIIGGGVIRVLMARRGGMSRATSAPPRTEERGASSSG